MIVGETFLRGDAVFTRWFTRQSDSVVFAIQTIAAVGTVGTMKCEFKVWTKKREESDTQATQVGTTEEIQEVKVHHFHYEGFETLFRFEIQVAGDEGDYAFLRMASPAWFSN